MPRERIVANTIEQAVEAIIPYLEDMSNNAHKAIYFDGWSGMAASAVLKAIAKDPPPSLLMKFNKIIHVDCLRWKSRRSLQRTIAEELKLPQRVMAIFDRRDEEDDFRGVDETSRAEIQAAGAEISQALREQIYLVIFHNGSDNTIDLNDFGITQLIIDRWFLVGSKVLWTFRGRLRLNSRICEEVDKSHLYLYGIYSTRGWNFLLQNEARDIAGYTDKICEATVQCCLYLLFLSYQQGNIMDYNWATHASNYWVCDGIIQGGQDDEAWELAAALHQQIRMEDYSSNALPFFGNELETPQKLWVLTKVNSIVQGRKNMYTVYPESTSFFLPAVISGSNPPLQLLPNDMFQQSENLHVLKLCHCAFSFSSPPFNCCRNLRFLGLDSCKDQQAEEDENQYISALEFCNNLWVLDICYTDWELDLSLEIIEQMAANIREIHIKKGRFWEINFAWRQLPNLRKLRVVDPTCSWETGEKDEFTNMVKMELLDLSGNSTIQVLPSLSRATRLKTLILDDCVGLEHVEGLPLSLESFSLDVGTRKKDYKEAKIIRISMVGCARLSDFKLHGSLPNLEELDLSGTKVKTLDLTTQLVPCLRKIMLLGCEKLCVVLWPRKRIPQLSFLCIDTRGGREVGRITRGPKKLPEGYCQAYIAMMDMRFIQSLVEPSYKDFCWNNNIFSVNFCISDTSTDGEHSSNKENMSAGVSRKILKSFISNPYYNTYSDVTIDDMTTDHDRNKSALQFQRSSCHVEIGGGISNTRVESLEGRKAIIFVMNKAESLHVHDNSSITTIIPENMTTMQGVDLITWKNLKQCHVVRCPKMHTVFITNYYCYYYYFPQLETFWAADILMAHYIWSKGSSSLYSRFPFVKLRCIHLYSCPRLTFVLQLVWWHTAGSCFPNLETLHIINCGDLVKIFPVVEEVPTEIATGKREGVLGFPTLKHIYLHELPRLQHICEVEVRMFAPKLETVRLRGCWSLRRLPAVGRDNRRCPVVVDCEKDWWENLEWDGHDPSLFEPRHSLYYKKPLPRVSVLR